MCENNGTDLAQNGDASFTYGCLDPTMLTQMAKYLDTVYMSGWQCSSTASSTHEPSPDLADYPMVCCNFRVRWVRALESLTFTRTRFPNRSSDCSWHSSSTTANSAKNVSLLLKPTGPALRIPTS